MASRGGQHGLGAYRAVSGFRYEGLLRRAHVNSLGRSDLWIGGLRDDDRAPAPWPAGG